MYDERFLGPDPGGEEIIIDLTNNKHYCCGVCRHEMLMNKGHGSVCSYCGTVFQEQQLGA